MAGKNRGTVSPGVEIEVTAGGVDPAWDAFVTQVPGGHHVQTSLWGEVRAVQGWSARRVICRREGAIVAGGQLLTHPMSHLGSVGYVTKGPLCASPEPELLDRVVEELKRVSRRDHVRYLVIQPPNNGQAAAERLPALGFRPSWIEVAPTATIVIDLTQSVEALGQQMKRQLRQNIRRSERSGITIREGTASDLDTFYRLHLSTSERQHFVPYPREYFATMWQKLGSAGCIALIMAEVQGETVSALLIVPFGDTVIAKILGWSGEHSDLRPNDAVFWGAIKWAKAHGYCRFDMEGINPEGAKAVLNGESLPEELQYTPDFFKLGFGGQVTLYPLAYDRVMNPVLRGLYSRLYSPQMAKWPPVRRLMDRLRNH